MCFTVPRRIIRSQHSASCCNAYASTHHTLLLRQSERNKLWNTRWGAKLWNTRWGANRPYLDSSRATARVEARRPSSPVVRAPPPTASLSIPAPCLPSHLIVRVDCGVSQLGQAGPGPKSSLFCLGQRVAFFCIFPSQQSFSIYQNKDDLQIEAYYPRCCGNRK